MLSQQSSCNNSYPQAPQAKFVLFKFLNLIKINKPTKYVVTERHCPVVGI